MAIHGIVDGDDFILLSFADLFGILLVVDVPPVGLLLTFELELLLGCWVLTEGSRFLGVLAAAFIFSGAALRDFQA